MRSLIFHQCQRKTVMKVMQRDAWASRQTDSVRQGPCTIGERRRMSGSTAPYHQASFN